jgi:cyanophycinase-like exopeptidase
MKPNFITRRNFAQLSIAAGLFSFLPIGHTKSNVNGKLLIIGGAEDRLNERVILKRFIELSGGNQAKLSSFLQLAASLHLYGQAIQMYLKILAQQM